MDITLKQLRYLVAVVDCGHFGRAAEQCHVSQPSLSVQIRELENRLGAVLLERGRDGVIPTVMGRVTVDRARAILNQTDGLIADVRQSRGLGGRIRIGMIPTIAPYLLPEVIKPLREALPDMEVAFHEAQTAQVLQMLKQAELDMAIAAIPNYDTAFLEIPLFEDAFVYAYGKEREGNLPSCPSEVAPDEFLLLDDGHCLADQSIAACGLMPADVAIDLRAAGLSSLARFVASGSGVTLLPMMAIPAEKAAAPDLRLHKFDTPPSRQIGLIMRANSTESMRSQIIADIMRTCGEALLSRAAKLV